MSHIAAIKYLNRLEGINQRFTPVVERAAKSVPFHKRKRFWISVVKASLVGFESITVPEIVWPRGRPG